MRTTDTADTTDTAAPTTTASARHLDLAHAVTTSRRADLEGQYPCVLVRGSGAVVTDLDGNDYFDLTSAFGSVLIGHAEPGIVRAVQDAVAEGNLFYTGASPRRLVVAHDLLDWFGWADRALFFKTGSCAVSAAVRLAQHATGRRDVLTTGYHGWHDWHLEAMPEFKLFESYATDIGENLTAHADEVAAVVVTPLPGEVPAEHYRRLNQLAADHGCVFIVDEVKTGMRAGAGGYSATAGLTPDLVTVSKGLANGHSISAVVGREAVMAAQEHAHIWSTYQNEQSSFAAAMASMRLLREWDVPTVVAAAGGRLADAVRDVVADLPVTVRSWGPSFTLDIPDPAVAAGLQTALLTEGVFCDVGDDFNVSYRLAEHVDEVIDRFARAVRGH